MSTGEGRLVSPEDVQIVQHFIELCIAQYMTQKQVIDILYQRQNIKPGVTELVWQRLEEQNQEFFKAYHLRLMVKEQITKFNNLLDTQAALMNQVDPSEVPFRLVSNGSHMPASKLLSASRFFHAGIPKNVHHNASCYASENTGIVLKTENLQHPVPTVLPSGFNNCGPSIHSGMQCALDVSAHSQRIGVPLHMLLAQTSNVGMMQGMNGLAIKTEPGYWGNSGFVYQAGGNVLEAHPSIDNASVSSFSCMDSDSHQLNGTPLDDTSSFELFRQISQNIGLPDLTADFTNNTDTLRFSKSEFPLPDGDNFLDSHGSTVEHRGENKRLDYISRNLGFQNFGRNL